MASTETTARPDRTASLFRALLRTPSVIALLIANLLPLYGVIALGWDLISLIMVYWLETGIIGFFAILNIALVTGSMALLLVPFFIVHFGGFMAGHLIFLITLFGATSGAGFSDIPGFVRGIVSSNGLWFAVAGLFVSHAIAFVVYVLIPWLQAVRRGTLNTRNVETGPIMMAPYGRIIIMHLTIIFGAILVTAFDNRLALLVLLIALKTAADLWGLLRRPAPAAPAAPAVVH